MTDTQPWNLNRRGWRQLASGLYSAAKLIQQYWSEILSGRSHHHLAHTYASRENYEIEWKFQEIRDYFSTTDHSAQSFRLEILGDQFQEQLIRCQQCFGEFQDARVAGR